MFARVPARALRARPLRTVLHLGVCELRAEYLQQCLTTLHVIAEFSQHARDAARDKRRDDHLPVGVRFNGAGDPHRGRAGGAPRHRDRLDARPFHRLHRYRHDDIRKRHPGRIAPPCARPRSLRHRRRGYRTRCVLHASTRTRELLHQQIGTAGANGQQRDRRGRDGRPTERDSGIAVHRTSPSARLRSRRAS